MAKTITAAELFEDVEVDLWGAQFRLREGTKQVNAQLTEKQAALEGMDDDDPDAVVAAVAEIMDVLLEPLGDEDGKKVRAKTVLLRKWNASEIGVDRIIAISEGIKAAAEGRGRPPSVETNGG